MLTYLKRYTPGSWKFLNTRLFCIIIVLMQVFTALFSILVMYYRLAQDLRLADIIKDTMTLLSINMLDTVFMTLFQQDLRNNLAKLNASGRFKISADSNST